MHRLGFVAPNLGDVHSKCESRRLRDGFAARPLRFGARARLQEPVSVDHPHVPDRSGRTRGRHAPSRRSTTPCRAFSARVFRAARHSLPAIVGQVWEGREAAKRQHNKPLSQALKIIMNSFYGVLGSSGCRFFDPRLASSITMRGHEIMHRTRELIEGAGYQVIYGDTDSTFVWLKHAHTEDEAQRIGRALVERVNGWWREHLQRRRSASTSALELRSRHALPALPDADDSRRRAGQQEALRGADRRCRTAADEMVYKGLETVRTDWTPLAQQFQQELYLRIFKRRAVSGFRARLRRPHACRRVR